MFSKRILRPMGLLAALLLAGISASAAKATPPEDLPISQNKWAPWFEFGGYGGSDGSSRGEAALWVPLAQSFSSLVFTEVRGKLFEHDVDELNIALGYRQMLSSGWNFGVWGGWDRRGTAFGNTFSQLAGGLELLSADFDLRFNGYVPVDDEKTLFASTAFAATGPATAELRGNQILLVTPGITTTSTATELALSGVDAEVGVRLFGGDTPGLPELRVYGGGFWFDHEDLKDAIAGPKARLELRFDDLIAALPGSRLTLESEYSHDNVRDDKWEIGARIRIPFGAGASQVASLTRQERRMMDAIERDTDIVTQGHATSSTSANFAEEGVEDALTGTALNRVEIVDAGGSLGAASASAGANSLIVVRGDPVQGAATIQGDQTVLGSGTAIELRGVLSGTVVSFTDGGARPTVASVDNGLTLSGDNIHVAGMDVQANTSFGINATSATNVVINHIGISGAGSLSDGVLIRGTGSEVRILDTIIENVSDDGVEMGGTGGHTVSVTGSVIRNVSYGLYNYGDNSSLTLIDTIISNTSNDGLLLTGSSNDTVLSGVTLSNIGSNAVRQIGTHTYTMNNSVVAGNIGRVLNLAGTPNLTGTGNTMSGATINWSFCSATSAWTGSIEFDGTTYTNADC